MTKRVVIALIFFLLSMIISIYANVRTVDALDEMLNVLGEYELSREETVSELRHIWAENRSCLSVFMKHTDADILERYVVALELYASDGENDYFYNTLSDFEAFVEVTLNTEKVKFENIF